jgi:hypothetical protein
MNRPKFIRVIALVGGAIGLIEAGLLVTSYRILVSEILVRSGQLLWRSRQKRPGIFSVSLFHRSRLSYIGILARSE